MGMAVRPRCRIFVLDGQKYKTNVFALFLDVPLRRKTATKTALLAEVLKRRNLHSVTQKAEELFGAVWDVNIVKKGEHQLLVFSLEMLKAVDVAEGVDFLRELLKAENIFSTETVERQKRILKRQLESRKDDKKAFANRRAMEETAKGTNFAVCADGYAEDLAEIDEKSLYAYFIEILEQTNAYLFFCGERTEKGKLLSLRKVFSGKYTSKTEPTEDGCGKRKPQFLSERDCMEQARLVLGFSADTDTAGRRAALLLCSQILGGDGNSLLFQQVREESGLCYDVRSAISPLAPYFFMQAGIKAEDAKRAGKEMLQCLKKLQEQPVSKERLKQAKQAVLQEYAAIADTPWAMVDFFAEQVLQDRPLSLDTFLRTIRRTDTEDVIRAAKRIRLQTVYLLGEQAKIWEKGERQR